MNVLISPYTEHYMNCYLNNLYSIACSCDNNYKLLSYQNEFSYAIIKNKLHFDYTDDFYLLIYNAIYKLNHNQKFDILKFPLGEKKKVDLKLLKDIPEYIESKQILFIMTDLFKFNNGNVFYSKIHREHYLLILGYNQDTNEFVVLDDGNKGYGIYNIEYNNFFLLIDQNTADGYVMDVSKIILPNKTELNHANIKNNANRLINEIKYIIHELFQIPCPTNYSEYCDFLIFVQRCFNRHISNKCLLGHLNSDNNIALGESLFDINKKLTSNWYNIRARMLKNTLAGEKIQYDEIFKK